MFFTRLFRPFIAFDGDETSGGAEPVEAPTVDQPDTSVDGPEAPAPATPDAEGSDTPEPETPETPEADADDAFTDLSAVPPELQDRAKEMQADYTRKTQALAERNAELDNAESFITDLVADEPNETMEAVFKTLAAKLGYDLDDDDTDTEGTDDVDQPDEPVDERTERDRYIDDLIARDKARQETEAAKAQEAHLDGIESGITTTIIDLAKAEGIVDLTEDEINVVFDSVLALPPEEQGPAVHAAYARYKAAIKADRNRWVQSKKAPQAPGATSAADEPVDFSNEEQRLAFTARAVEAAMRAESGS